MDSPAIFTDLYIDDINYVTEHNTYYRKILATSPNMQLAIMSLRPQEEIGIEIHPYITQFFRIEQGEGVAIINNLEYDLYPGIALVIPLNTKHNIINTSKDEDLKLYTIYTPPNHSFNKSEKYKI